MEVNCDQLNCDRDFESFFWKSFTLGKNNWTIKQWGRGMQFQATHIRHRAEGCQDVRKTNIPATMDSVWGWVKDATSWLTAKMSLMKKVATSWRYWMGTTRRSHHTFWMTLLMCQFQFSFSNWLISTRRITQLRSACCGKTKGWHSTAWSSPTHVMSSHMKTSKSWGPYKASKQQTNNQKYYWEPNDKTD